jgi:hypothetical protein
MGALLCQRRRPWTLAGVLQLPQAAAPPSLPPQQPQPKTLTEDGTLGLPPLEPPGGSKCGGGGSGGGAREREHDQANMVAEGPCCIDLYEIICAVKRRAKAAEGGSVAGPQSALYSSPRPRRRPAISLRLQPHALGAAAAEVPHGGRASDPVVPGPH